MTFYILANQITTLFISLHLLTTISFEGEVRSYLFGGNKDDITLELANNNKTLAMKAKKKDIDTNLLVVTSKNKYYFHVKTAESKSHQFIEVYDGIINNAYSKIKETKNYDLFEGVSSVFIVNKSNEKMLVNEMEVTKGKLYISKGVPIILNGERIYN
jgi:type IV secretory pathway VirB9-like protein